MKKLLCLALFSVMFFTVMAQTITGRLTDAESQPIEYANIVLMAQADSTFITGAVSGADGNFLLVKPSGTAEACLLKVTCVGYKTVCMPAPADNNPAIIMEHDTQMLGEVVIKSNLPVTRIKGDALVTNVEGSVLAKAGTAQDLLAYIPAVSAQGGSLSVFRRGTPLVYINGRQVRDNSELDQLSSDNIKSVEVITNPGARYAASVKAVIRIHTKKAVGEGFGFNNRVYAAYNKEGSFLDQLNLNYRQGGLDVFGLLYYSDSYWWRNYDAVQNTHLDKHWQQKLHTQEENRTKSFIGNVGLNYVFNPNHSVGFRYQLTRKPDTDANGFMTAAILRDSDPFENTQSVFSAFSQSSRHTVNLYYSGKVGAWNIDFNTDLLWMETNEETLTQEDITPTEGEKVSRDVNTFNDTDNKLYASKLVFSRQLWGGGFSLGGEYSHARRNNDYRNPEGILLNDASEIKEGNTAVFVEYSREFGNVEMQAGLRYENVSFNYYQSGVHNNEQSKDYNNLFPSLSLTTSVGKVQMQLSYTQDISRPSFNSLRSAITYNNHYLYETGNPLLQPSITHNISLLGAYKWVQLYAGYQHVKNDMVRIVVPYSEDDPTIALMKLANANSYNKVFLMLSASPTIGIWSPQFTLGTQKQWYKVESPDGIISLNQPIISFKWQNSLQLPAGFILNVSGGWYSKYDEQNYSLKPEWGIDASLYKGFLKNRLSFQLQATDIFQTNHSQCMYYYGKSYTMSQDIEPNSRNISLTVRYRFNQGRNKYKGTGAGDSQKSRL